MHKKHQMKYVQIPWTYSATEKAENFLVHQFNERYKRMSEEQKQSDIVQDELELLWELQKLRARKNRPRVNRIKESLLSRGLVGLTESEWRRLQKRGIIPSEDRKIAN